MKKQNKKLLIGLGFIVMIVLFLVVISLNQKQSTFFYDKELGLIEISTGGQITQSVFTKTNIVLGESLTISDNVLLSRESFGITKVVDKIYKNNVLITSFDKTTSFGKTYSYTWKPSSIGVYSLVQEVTYSSGETLKSGDCSLCKATVTEPQNQCSKSPYWSSWSFLSNIENGVRQRRTYYIVTSNCGYEDRSTDDRFVCNDGYVVEGTDSTMATYTGSNKNCVLKEVVIEEPIEPPIECECNGDVSQTCEDGSEIIIKTCDGCYLSDTNNKCQEQYDDTDDDTDTDTDTDEESFLEKYESYFMYTGAGLVILLVLFIAYNFIRKRK